MALPILATGGTGTPGRPVVRHLRGTDQAGEDEIRFVTGDPDTGGGMNGADGREPEGRKTKAPLGR